MPTKFAASVLYGAKDLRLEQRELGKPQSGELQIEIRATGLCGSDLHYYKDYRNGDIHIREPLTLGHESSGIVAEIGPFVEGFLVGDRVALEVGIPCGSCPRCDEARYNLCKKLRFRSSGSSIPPFQGTLQQRINHPSLFCYKLPDSISFIEGALLEPLSVAMHAAKRAQLESLAKFSVLIFGAGTIGLLCAAMCAAYGADKIRIADVQGDRVQFATFHEYAKEGMIIPLRQTTSLEEDLEVAKATAIQACDNESNQCTGFDVVFECTGAEACTQAAIYATRAGGKVVLVGMGNPNQTLPMSAATLREVDILGTFRYANTYQEAIELLKNKDSTLPELKKLVTHVFHGLSNVDSAFRMANETHDKAGKLVLKVMVTQDESP